MPLNQHEAVTTQARIAEIEARTGVQLTTVMVGRGDAYDELPWKAFALCASLAALVTLLAATLGDGWLQPLMRYAALSQALVILGTGAAGALAAVSVPSWARLFLRPARRDAEV